MIKLVVGLLLVAYAAALTGCGVVKGAGKDITEAGKNIQKAAS